MFPIKLDKINIILLATAGLLGAWSIFIPIPAGGFFPLILAIVLIAYIRSVYLISGKNAALLMSLIFLLIPLVLYAFYYSLTSDTATANIIGKLLPRILILFAVLLGVGILYTITNIGIAIISPETSNQLELSRILRDAKSQFGFLLEKGYKISELKYVNHPNAGWHLQFDSPDDVISIILDQQERPLLVLGKEKTDKPYQILLEAMIYFLTEKKVFVGNSSTDSILSRSQVFKEVAKLLKSYINQIENYTRNDFEITKNELSKIQGDYGDLLVQEFEQGLKLKRQ